jgi:hypothetical protein
MKSYLVVAVLAVLAIMIVGLMPPAVPAVISHEQVLNLSESAPEVQLFRSMYPSAVFTTQQMGCIPSFFENYVRDLSAPLMARNRDVSCSEKDKDWLVGYSATGVVDTDSLLVGVDDDNGGKRIDAAFISPYDDIYVLNYTLATTEFILEKVMVKGNYSANGGWASRVTDDGTKYLIYLSPEGDYTALAVYIEKTPNYKLATTDNLRSEITAAHEKFGAEGSYLNALMRSSFLGGMNVTSSYLYYPEPTAAE